MAVAGETVARPVNLAQARQTGARLDQSTRVVAQATCSLFWASEHLAQARGVSPKRYPALLPDALFEPSPRRRGLAWARPFSL